MKILKLIIKDYQQFRNLELDFTHPETGEPLDKVCFIGRNATGKSTILWILNEVLNGNVFSTKAFIIFKIKLQDKIYYQIFHNNIQLNLDGLIDKHVENWMSIFLKTEQINELDSIINGTKEFIGLHEFIPDYQFFIKDISSLLSKSLVIYSPPESDENNYLFDGVPKTTVREALELFENFQYSHIVSNQTVMDFWKLIVYHIKKREANFIEFAERNENVSYKQLKEEFNEKNPEILIELEKIWNNILDYAKLFFDIETAIKPIQLDDNLKVYIKSKITNEVIQYKNLSTGIRNFIFKIGHIYSLYFNRKIESGFLLVDEPENSLFPDFLYDLIDDVYCKIIENQNTQFFVSTHNPIIAAQFEPYERIILDFDNEGYVVAKKGTVPVGDDPNDILFKDFGMRSLLTQKGQEKYKRFLQLEGLVKNEKDAPKRIELMKEYLQIGTDYNFAENEILTKE